ncbi:MAG: AAA family ATPase [Oscillospiraceae bacterium]|nr:AAA family ATPase [Oscillospiraceae bacterium]
MQLACEYLQTLWPKSGMEVETEFRIVRYQPLPGEEYSYEFTAKGEGLPESNYFEIVLEGDMVSDAQYGDTFLVRSFQTRVKRTKENVLGYLSSGAVKGVGPAVAKKIVDYFGVEALEILEHDPKRLREVNGIGEKVLETITSSFEENREVNALLLYIGQYYANALNSDPNAKCPVTLNKARKIVAHFGDRALEIIRSDIYHLCEVDGFGFLTVDNMAQRMQKPMNTLPRVKAAALYILKQARQQYGHLYLTPEEFLQELKKNLNHKKATYRFSEQELRPLANEVLCTEQIAYHNKSIYLLKDYQNEKSFADKKAIRLYQDRFNRRIPPASIKNGETLSEEQKQATIMALLHNTCVITGGPGTGKTTTVRTILENLVGKGVRRDAILLCAPTGRAAKRLAEATGYPACTIHRAFGIWEDSSDDAGSIKALDLVIVDEVSMLDMWLGAQLLSRISPETRLILVGDAAQLPSVGPGNVLAEIIRSGVVPVVQLKTVFRQASGSSIAVNAQLIDSRETELVFDDNFAMIPAKDQQEAIYLLCALYKRAVESAGPENVQILTPVRKEGHQCGVNNLNTSIQSMVQDAPGLGYHHYGRYYCVGDPVIQNKNAGGVYNGEIGVVTEVEPDKIHIRFAGYEKDLVYDDEKIGLLDLAYALTVHKSQGSEYSIVIVPVLKEHTFMLTRNLIYTAITRGKSKVFLVGNRWALERAIKKEDTSKRHTHLALRIQSSYNRLLEAEKNVAA